MKSLIWKEWRETRWLTIVLLVLCLVSSLCWKLVKPGEAHVIGPPIWTVLALFIGARAFAGEKQASTIEFLSAQPLRKAHLWAIKAAWGFGIVMAVVAISCLFDYILMLADPFYEAFHLLELPLSWIVLALLAVYSVALLSSTIADKTVVALGLNVAMWPIIGLFVAGFDRFNPHFFQFVNEWWGVPLALVWFSFVVLAVSFVIITWREIWPTYPAALKVGAAVFGGVTVILLLIVSTANISPDRITRINWLRAPAEIRRFAETRREVEATVLWRGKLIKVGPPATSLDFSASVGGRELPPWRIDDFGHFLQKSSEPPFRQRKHPAWSAKNLVELTRGCAVAKIVSGEDAGGYLVENIERPLRYQSQFGMPRRVRTTIRPIENSSLSWLGISTSLAGRRRTRYYQFYFAEELPNGQKHVRVFYREGDEPVRTARVGALEAISPWRSRCIWSSAPDEGKVMLHTVIWRREGMDSKLAEMDEDVRSTISFVTEAVVRYELGGKTFLADADNLKRPGFEVPQGVLSRGPDALRRLAEGLMNPELERLGNLPQVSPVLESVAAGWGVDVPEELFDKAIFVVPRNRQIVYVKKDNEQQSSVWLLEVESGESKKILDDIDVTSPAVPEALVAPIMSDYFAFVRDTKTIWTYRDGTLTQIFPPER